MPSAGAPVTTSPVKTTRSGRSVARMRSRRAKVFSGLGKPPGFGGVEVHIRELRYLESLVAAEAQHRLLRPDGGRTPDEEGAGRENPLVHLLKIHWFNFTLPLFSTCTVLLRPSPHVTTNSNGTLVETVTAGVSSADLRARTLRSTTPSGPNG